MNSLACEAEVTDSWFVPHFLPREDRPYEVAMSRSWIKYMSYENYYDAMWSSKIASILSGIPRALNERGSRVAMTFAIWLMTPVGNSFLETLFKDQKKYITSSSGFAYENVDVAIRSWASQNKLSSYTTNTLSHLLKDWQGLPIYTDPPYPTLEDCRVVEGMCCFFVSDEGKDLLRKVYKNAAKKTDKFGTRSLPFTENVIRK